MASQKTVELLTELVSDLETDLARAQSRNEHIRVSLRLSKAEAVLAELNSLPAAAS